jgi:hypothetical protein
MAGTSVRRTMLGTTTPIVTELPLRLVTRPSSAASTRLDDRADLLARDPARSDPRVSDQCDEVRVRQIAIHSTRPDR